MTWWKKKKRPISLEIWGKLGKVRKKTIFCFTAFLWGVDNIVVKIIVPDHPGPSIDSAILELFTLGT